MKRLRPLFVSALLFASACSGADDGVREVGTKKANESVDDAKTLVVRDGIGHVKVTGVKSLSLDVEATLVTSETSESKDSAALAVMNVQPQAEPGSIVLDFNWKLPANYRPVVQIEASRELTLEINDRSGDIHVSDWEGKVIITDGTGDIVLNNVKDYKIESKSSGKLVVDGKEEIFE